MVILSHGEIHQTHHITGVTCTPYWRLRSQKTHKKKLWYPLSSTTAMHYSDSRKLKAEILGFLLPVDKEWWSFCGLPLTGVTEKLFSWTGPQYLLNGQLTKWNQNSTILMPLVIQINENNFCWFNSLLSWNHISKDSKPIQ